MDEFNEDTRIENMKDNEWCGIDWIEVKNDEREESIWDDINWNDAETGEQKESIWSEIDWEESDCNNENRELEPEKLDPNEGEENYECNEYEQSEMESDDKSNYDLHEYGDNFEQEEYPGGFYENSYAEVMNTILLSENQIYEYLQEYIQLEIEKEHEGTKQEKQSELGNSNEEISELEKFLEEERERIRLEQQQANLDEGIETKIEPIANEEEIEQEEEIETQDNISEEMNSNNEEGVENLKLDTEENQKYEQQQSEDQIKEEHEVDPESIGHEKELKHPKKENEDREEYEELAKKEELGQFSQELEIEKELNSGQTDFLLNNQDEELEFDYTSPYKKSQNKTEELIDHQQELEEILEQTKKIEQEQEQLDRLIGNNYDDAKKLYIQETRKRPIYANKETKGFKEWLEKKNESEGKSKGEQIKEQNVEQEKEEEWLQFLINWLKEESGEEINLQMKDKLIEIIDEYNEYDELTTKFQELFQKRQLKQLSQSEKIELKTSIKTLQKSDPSNIVLFTNLRTLRRFLSYKELTIAQLNQMLNHLFTRFIPIKQLDVILKSNKDNAEVKEDKKKSDYLEDLKEIAIKRGGTCLSRNYVNNKTKLEFRCHEGHIWKATPNSIKDGTWCPECYRNKKGYLKQINKIAEMRGGICLSKNYINSHTNLEFRCHLGHEWRTAPYLIKSGHWCPKCSQGMSERITRRFFEEIFKEKFPTTKFKWLLNTKRNIMHLDGFSIKLNLGFEYNGAQHYKFKDNWFGTKEDFDRQKKDDKLKKDLCKAHGITLIEIPYTIKFDNLEDFIVRTTRRRGIHVDPKLDNLDWRKFKIIPPFKLKNLQKIALERGGKLLSKHYYNNRTKLTFQCSEGHTWKTQPNHINAGNWCPVCYEEEIKKKIQELIDIIKIKNGKLLSVYKNNKTKVKIKCFKGHVWDVLPSSIKSGSWCPKCYHDKDYFLKQIKEIAESKGGKCLTDEYMNNKTKMNFKCIEGHEWCATAKSIKEGTWCPHCYKKYGTKSSLD